MIRSILSIDDHPLFGAALFAVLEDGPDPCRVHTAASLAAGLQMLREARIDLVLLDLSLPGCAGLDALQAVRAECPEVPVLVLSATESSQVSDACLRAGARAFLHKSMRRDQLIETVRGHLRDDVPGPAPRLPRLADRIDDPRDLGLTDRQVDVLRLILQGMPNKLICRRLDLAEGTVKVHVSAVLRALGVRSRTQALVAADRLGLRV